ncbi:MULTISPECIES: hypothetical protein [Pseudomonas]|uniref:DUF1269 domain-containing protein n=1 Tax=Pseudomonas spirodelae TaxID=3101751 RepID=A0ABU5PD85_9PSED|nr:MULTISPECIES: hypothetical protein [unclassified Pseudomonas]MDD2162691.1 hypothetical protein [Pseudomonas sp. MIL19]MEA1607662.1 hypothetical protein [Pseudomonas sp. T5W1]
MDLYRHHVSGFFSQRSSAEQALAQLIQRGMHSEQLQIVASNADAPPAPAPRAKSNRVLKNMLIDIAIGTGIGIGIGALIAVAMIVSEASLFYASPLLAPLALMGMSGFIGGFLGSVIGASSAAGTHHGRLVALVSKSITHGDVVLVAQTDNEQQTSMAREVIEATAGLVKDINMATNQSP